MQVTCFGLNWTEATKRGDAALIVEEMVHSDDADLYTAEVPEEIWPSDSATAHFGLASALAELHASPEAARFPGLPAIAALISDGETIDELGLSAVTEGTCFISLSPERIEPILQAFAQTNVEELASTCARLSGEPEVDLQLWLRQWRDALSFVRSRNHGLVAHCG